jgi:Putative metallopeptidase domain
MSDRESELLAQRLVSCLPAASFELETLCRLAGIAASRAVDTAAVTCEGRSRLLVNPDFVADHCRRDEHLFLLVMHELWHVILAHTRLWPRPTTNHNIAFDAVINAGLARQHPEPEYRGFFEALNPADAFPGVLLRPPPGWPAAPRYRRAGFPRGTDGIMRRLYPPPGSPVREPHYEEILAVLDRGDAAAGRTAPFLLGDHSDRCADERALDDPLLGDVVRRIVARWPPPPFPLAGRDIGGAVQGWTAALAPPAEDVRRVFAGVLRRCLGPAPGGVVRRSRVDVAVVGGTGVWPNAADRLAPARRLLGAPATLWAQPATTPARVPERPASAHVYLDVSGSMTELLPRLLGLLVPFVADGRAAAWQFSTTVEPLPLAALRRGRLATTMGTSIDCVVEHLLAHPAVRRAVVVTDGYVGVARADLARRVADTGIRVHAVLPAESAWTADVAALGAAVTVLPPLRPSDGATHTARGRR